MSGFGATMPALQTALCLMLFMTVLRLIAKPVPQASPLGCTDLFIGRGAIGAAWNPVVGPQGFFTRFVALMSL